MEKSFKNGLSLVSCIFLILSTVSINPVATSASADAWWDTSWQYRKPISVTNGGSNPLTDYQVLIEVDTALLISTGKMRPDCGDMRFTTAEGSVLSYWIESGKNTSTTKVWVKIPSISASGSTTIYMYYGNPNATSTADGNATFEFFDDFDGGLGKWTNFGYPSPATFSSTEFHDGWGYSTEGDSWYPSGSYSNTLVNVADGIVLEARLKVKDSSWSHWDYLGLGIGSLQSGYNDGSGTPGTLGEVYFSIHVSGAQYPDYAVDKIAYHNMWWDHPRYDAALMEANDFGWHRYTIKYDPLTTIASYYKDGVFKVENSSGPRPYDKLPIVICGRDYHNTNYLDFVFVRKYAKSEPTASVGAEESSGVSSSAPLPLEPEPRLIKQWNYQFGKIWWRMVLGPSPAVADLGYGDQNLEIITGNDEYYPIPGVSGRWFAFNASGNVLWTLNTGNDESRSSVAIVDVDQDGDLEVVGGTTSGWHLQLFDPSGEMLWSRPIWYFVHSSPAVADLCPDVQGLEIVAGTYTGRVFCFDAAGNILWSYATGSTKYWWWYGGRVISSPSIADIDGDGTLEVVVSSSDANWFGWWSYRTWWSNIKSTLHVINGETGAAKWTYEFTDAYGAVSSAALANLDQDEGLEIIVGSGDGKVYRFDGATGVVEWTFATDDGVYSSPAIGDIDNDGEFDIVIGSNDGKVYALNADGGLKWSYTTGGAVWSSPALADRGTGGLDVYIGSEDGYLYLIEGKSGILIDKFSTGEPIRSSPIIADIDGDQKLEVLFLSWARKQTSSWYWLYSDFRTSGDDLWALEDTGSQVAKHAVEWGMFRRDERRTGVYPLSSPTEELKPVSPETTVDIAPNTLNFKSRGKWITAYIELAKGWDVNDIDLASIRLNDVLETEGPSEVGDEDQDGIPDLMVKFDRQALIEMLKNSVETPGKVELRVTGDVLLEPDAYPFEVSKFSFEASENIRVINPGQGNNSGQVNKP